MSSPSSAEPEHKAPGLSLPAWWFLALYAGLMLLVPSELVIAPLGSAGTPATLVGLGLLIWWVCAKLGQGVPRPALVSPLHLALGLLAAAVLLSFASGLLSGWIRPADIRQETDVVWSLLPVTLTELQEKSALGAFRGLIAIGSWLGAALMLMDGVRSRSDVTRLINWLVWLASVVAAIGIYQYFTGDNLARFIKLPGLGATYDFGVTISRSVLNRVSATTTHPIEFSVVLTVIFPLALHRALYPATIWGKSSSLTTRWLPVVLLGIAIPMSVSRTGILALAIAMGILFAGWSPRRRLVLLVVAPVAAVMMRSALPGLLGTIRSLITQSLGDPSVTARTEDYGVVADLYSDHPLLGRGPFTFIPQYYRTLDNQLLVNLIELGAVGLAATLGVFLCGFYLARYCKRHGLTDEHRHLGLVLSAAIAAMLSTYATFDAWGFAKSGATTFLLFGIAGAAWRMTISETKSSEAVR